MLQHFAINSLTFRFGIFWTSNSNRINRSAQIRTHMPGWIGELVSGIFTWKGGYPKSSKSWWRAKGSWWLRLPVLFTLSTGVERKFFSSKKWDNMNRSLSFRQGLWCLACGYLLLFEERMGKECQTYNSLIFIGNQAGYKAPVYAYMVTTKRCRNVFPGC